MVLRAPTPAISPAFAANAAVAPQVRQLERTVGLKDLTVAEMEGRLREMSATTFDGVFVWRISDFAKKRQDAIAGRAPAMFSPGMPDQVNANANRLRAASLRVHVYLPSSLLHQ